MGRPQDGPFDHPDVNVDWWSLERVAVDRRWLERGAMGHYTVDERRLVGCSLVRRTVEFHGLGRCSLVGCTMERGSLEFRDLGGCSLVGRSWVRRSVGLKCSDWLKLNRS